MAADKNISELEKDIAILEKWQKFAKAEYDKASDPNIKQLLEQLLNRYMLEIATLKNDSQAIQFKKHLHSVFKKKGW